eukprot:3102252-Prymnesium_polylepis.2
MAANMVILLVAGSTSAAAVEKCRTRRPARSPCRSSAPRSMGHVLAQTRREAPIDRGPTDEAARRCAAGSSGHVDLRHVTEGWKRGPSLTPLTAVRRDTNLWSSMSDSAVTVRTKKFITNRLLQRKQFVRRRAGPLTPHPLASRRAKPSSGHGAVPCRAPPAHGWQRPKAGAAAERCRAAASSGR